MLERMDDLTSCSLSYVASILGGKWKPFIVWYLSMAPGKRARYSELRKSIPYDISHKMFSQHLSELEQVGIIERVVVEVKPLRVDYLLTERASASRTSCTSSAIGARRTAAFLRRRCSARRARWARACWCTAAPTTAPSRGLRSVSPGNSILRRSTCAPARAKATHAKATRPKRSLRALKRGPCQGALRACRPPCGPSRLSFDYPSVSLSGKKRTYKCIIAPVFPRQQNTR